MAIPEFEEKDRLKQLPALLLPWFSTAARTLPWRQDRLPYHVWLSEIMLQQTRVEAVKGYYLRFLSALPDLPALAAADPDLLLKLWEGLGYYNRVRNLQKAAQRICSEYGGSFPREYRLVRALPGIGDYTAGAICSICFDQPTPAVDGNVLRVIARLCGYYGCTDDLKVRKRISELLAEIYPSESGTFTQALMELGAIVCVPNGAPKCTVCPLRELCIAKAKALTDELPVRAEKKKRKQETYTVFLLRCGDEIALRKRPASGLLAGLYEFPNVPGALTVEAAIETATGWNTHPQELIRLVQRSHIFTHIEWKLQGIRLDCAEMPPQFQWVDYHTITEEFALPTAFRQFLQDFDMQEEQTNDRP